MTIQEKARELGQRLAHSTLPQALKDTIFEALPKSSAQDLDGLLLALRNEAAQLQDLEDASRRFVACTAERWDALAAEEQAVVDVAVEEFVAATASDVLARAAQRSGVSV
ncbi:hypothetical protein HY632_02185 [Candidatus Uhrbacteria bacterium]|nr:hypothetical protein [Candidatus Uhrbacteria bacterium]